MMVDLHSLNFLWGEALWGLLLLPLLVLLYLWLMSQRKKNSVQWSSLAIVKAAMGPQRAWRRHVPPALLLLALAALITATSRPTAVLTLPLVEQTIILAMDVSGSMRATDVEPNRLVATLPRSVRVGVVSFAGTAAVVQPPTLSREDVTAAIDRFQLQRGTAIGSGIVLSLATLFPGAGIDLSQITGARPMPKALGEADKDASFTPVEPGSYNSAVVVLLTDGQRTTGRMAADRGVKVYTVGIGTKEGDTIGFEGWTMRVRLDEETLKQIASATRAEYFYAGTAIDLTQVYKSLGMRLSAQKKETEITALFAALGALLTVLAAALSVWWFGKVA
jgi:Ca-activated chloride channel homolog